MTERETARLAREVDGPFGVPVRIDEEAVTLKAGALNLFDATAVAVSSTAPAYSLASALGSLVLISAVGLHAPSMILVSFVPILFIAYAYFHLNRRNPNCGASYTWLSEIFHPAVGWFNGFLQIGISVIFCVQAPIVAATYSLSFLQSIGWISQDTANSTMWTTVLAMGWLVLITSFCVYGIRWATNFQWILVIVEYVAVVVFSIGGIIKVALSSHPEKYSSFHASWFNPFGVHGIGSIATAMAIGTFLFWGWDTAVNLNEESKDPSRIPGRAAIISMWLVLGIFVLNFVAAQMLLPRSTLENSDDLLFVFGQAFAGKWAAWVMLFAVLSSTVATTQTTLLPSARISYSMARDGVFPKLFGSVSRKFQTPIKGTLVLAAISGATIVLVGVDSGASDVISTFTNNVGAIVALYYGLTGLACAWAFRKAWREQWWFTLSGIVLPFLSGGVLLAIVAFDIAQNGWSGMKWDIMLLVASAVLTPIVWLKNRDRAFFQQATVAYDSIEGA